MSNIGPSLGIFRDSITKEQFEMRYNGFLLNTKERLQMRLRWLEVELDRPYLEVSCWAVG